MAGASRAKAAKAKAAKESAARVEEAQEAAHRATREAEVAVRDGLQMHEDQAGAFAIMQATALQTRLQAGDLGDCTALLDKRFDDQETLAAVDAYLEALASEEVVAKLS